MSLTFACELPSGPLTALFADERVMDALKELNARVSLGLLDLGPERAEVVRRLNAAGVPVVAWLLLPESEGYWCNADNGPRVVARYAAFSSWTAEQDLVWDGIGLGIEPHIALMERLMKGQVHRAAPGMVRNLFDRERIDRAQAIYSTLVTQMRLDGYQVESYQFPFILDERRIRTTVLQRVLGIIDLEVDREVLMLYSSLMGRVGPGLLWSYGQEIAARGGGIGIGSTGGGVEIGADIQPLTWSEFTRDLRWAWRLTDDVFIFSLEGCARRGFLPWLAELQPHKGALPEGAVPVLQEEAPLEPRVAMVPAVQVGRIALRGMLWASAHPLAIAGVLAGGVVMARSLRRRSARRSHRLE
jgi:hypothetical protein